MPTADTNCSQEFRVFRNSGFYLSFFNKVLRSCPSPFSSIKSSTIPSIVLDTPEFRLNFILAITRVGFLHFIYSSFFFSKTRNFIVFVLFFSFSLRHNSKSHRFFHGLIYLSPFLSLSLFSSSIIISDGERAKSNRETLDESIRFAKLAGQM